MHVHLYNQSRLPVDSGVHALITIACTNVYFIVHALYLYTGYLKSSRRCSRKYVRVKNAQAVTSTSIKPGTAEVASSLECGEYVL